MQNRYNLILSFVLLLVLNMACQKNHKAPRPLDVTQKILTDRAGEYQNINGYSIKFGSDKKLILTKKFISKQLYNLGADPSTKDSETKDFYCMNSMELDIILVKEYTLSGLIEIYPNYKWVTQLDPNKPVYILEGTYVSNNSKIFEDAHFSVLSKAEPGRAESCLSEDNSATSSGSPYLVQYTDTNSLLFLSMFQNSDYSKFEPFYKFYKTLEDPAYSSDDFLKMFSSFSHQEITIQFGKYSRSGDLAHNKESKLVIIDVPSIPARAAIPELCGFHFVVEWSRMCKKNINSFSLMVLKSFYFLYVSDPYFNFIDPKVVKIDFADSGPHSQICIAELNEIKKIERQPSEFLFAFLHSSDKGTFFVFSPKNLIMNIQADYFFPYENK